jgi:hypothetical protein
LYWAATKKKRRCFLRLNVTFYVFYGKFLNFLQHERLQYREHIHLKKVANAFCVHCSKTVEEAVVILFFLNLVQITFILLVMCVYSIFRGGGDGVQRYFQQYFSYIVAVFYIYNVDVNNNLIKLVKQSTKIIIDLISTFTCIGVDWQMSS